ncbi:MAG TPA: HAD family hydrolase [Desulfuromonadales bacterium]|nr:HAD family hydrolase [Desulfuromonadales bacterium]
MNASAIDLLESRSCWIFDLDGTLTQPVHDFAFIRSELSIPDDADILGHLDTLLPEEAALRHSRLFDIEYNLACQAVPAPGALDLLALLESLGIRMGILTRNSREIALQTLETIRARCYFVDSHVLGRDEVSPKPDPAGIFHLLEQWQADADCVVMVGDYLFDLQAGRAAGAITVHVGRPDCQRWPEFSDIMVDSLVELHKAYELKGSNHGKRVSG